MHQMLSIHNCKETSQVYEKGLIPFFVEKERDKLRHMHSFTHSSFTYVFQINICSALLDIKHRGESHCPQAVYSLKGIKLTSSYHKADQTRESSKGYKVPWG